MTTNRCENGGALDAFRTLLEMGWGNVDSAALVRKVGMLPPRQKRARWGTLKIVSGKKDVDYLLIGR